MNGEDRRGPRTRESGTSADALYYQPLYLLSLYNISITPFRKPNAREDDRECYQS